MSRRRLLRSAASLGAMAAATSVLEACGAGATPGTTPTPGVTRLPTRTSAPSPTGTATPPPTSTATRPPSPTPSATATASPTAEPSATPTASATPDAAATAAAAGTARVAFVKTTDRADGVRRALALLGVNPARGEHVRLKPNFNSADPPPGSTHPDVLRSLVQALWDGGAKSITVADRSGMGDTRRVMEQKGVLDLARELGFDTIVLDDLEQKDWVMQQPHAGHWERGFPLARLFLEGPTVQTCCLKTHRYGGHFTMSLKNSVGMVAKFDPGGRYNYMSELHGSPHQRQMIAEINAAYAPALVVMDGVEAFTTGGPDTGTRVAPEVVLAATDRVALDAVGVAILRYFGTTPDVSRGTIFQQEQIARAVELGLGVSGPDEIQLITDDEDSAAYAGEISAVLAQY
jgi:uncharacterized protein (DUF362 family)